MGTITQRKRKNGTLGFTAQIRIKRDGEIVHTEAQTFDRKQAAAAWIARREEELEKTPSKMGRKEAAGEDPRLDDVIDRYIKENTKIGRTKGQVLRTLKSYDIASMRGSQIKSPHLVTLATELGQDKKPQTVGNYMSHLQAVFALAHEAWGYPLDVAEMVKAMRSARRLGTVARSTKRDRRPTLGELDRIMQHFQQMQERGRAEIPMMKLTAFALFSTRRQEEITAIRWDDYEGDRVLVRDMKHPGQTVGNNVWCDLPPEASRIIDTMERTSERIFPYNHRSVSASFTRACGFLGISGDNMPDSQKLVFHDLRHEGISRLSEMGKTIQQVTQVSGHRSLASLTRYTHMRQTGDKYAAWPWLGVVTKADS